MAKKAKAVLIKMLQDACIKTSSSLILLAFTGLHFQFLTWATAIGCILVALDLIYVASRIESPIDSKETTNRSSVNL